MNFEAVIGLEIHVELKTKTKMFSPSPNRFSPIHNINVNAIDMAFPGTMPSVNKQVVINAIRVCNALHMTIDKELHFDRKNYFYSDLPKGYQITQQRRPIGSEGYVEFEIEGKVRRIEIERLHMEEDTCKQLHFRDFTLLDYNRAGVPLIEIVSKPTIKNGLEAMKYVETIRNIVTYAEVSDGKMEEGSLRCDVNVSIRPCGEEKLGTKVEIKNLNSTFNVKRAIDFEMQRQAKILLSGGEVIQETRRFDEAKKETVLMRVKTDAVDYKYFEEPNISPIKLSDEFIQAAIDSCPELIDAKREKYASYGLSNYDTEVLLSSKETAIYFEELIKYTKEYKIAANWINGEIQTILNKRKISINELEISIEDLAYIVNMIGNGKLTSKTAREIFNKCLNGNFDVKKLCESSCNETITDENSLREIIVEIINNNPQSVVDYKNGKDRIVGFIVGQVMKQSHGKANPALTSKIVIEELKK